MIYLYLFLEFFKIGLFTLGGGYAMIPLLKEVVLNYGWIDESQFYDFIGICESTPGPIAINMATFIGTTQGGVFGGIVATLGVVLPSFLIILLIAAVLKNFIKNVHIKKFLDGVKPVVIGLIFSTALVLILKCVGYQTDFIFEVDWVSIIVFISIIFIYLLYRLIFKKKMNAISVILSSAFLGIIVNLLFSL